MAMADLFNPLGVFLLVLVVGLLKRFLSNRSPLPLPPGPKGWPLLGNLFDLPSSQEWIKYAQWGEKWGDIISVSVFGQRIVVLNSASAAIDMLHKKSTIYSDRPFMQMAGEMVGWKNMLVLFNYGDRLREHRQMFHKCIGSHSSSAQFYPIAELETHRFLKRLLVNPSPDGLKTHIRGLAGAIILRISYGYQVTGRDDLFVALADKAMKEFSLVTAPGGFLVNQVPALRHIPSWFPGAGFKKTAKIYAQSLSAMVNEPYKFVKQQMAEGVAETSLMSSLLSEPHMTASRENDIKWGSLALYAGGSDTTVSSIYVFFLAMILYPATMKKAQQEIDTVIGNDRLPSLADRENLPFLNAVTLEVLRWFTITPTGFFHRLRENDTHDGYFIPKGSFIATNLWKMAHDPRVYSDPFTFKPERFLGPNPEQDPHQHCFGFGRRICPGKLLAESSIFISSTMTLAVFDIAKYSKDGVVYEPSLGQTTGTVSHPLPFKCSITPRSQKAIDLIMAAENSDIQGGTVELEGGRRPEQ